MLRTITMHPREAINWFKILHRTKEIIRYEKRDELTKQIADPKKDKESNSIAK